MNLVVDTNIVFSTLLNPHSTIGEILINIQDDIVFYAPELLKAELKRYSAKISTYSKLSKEDLSNIESAVLSTLNFIDEEFIGEDSWTKAISYTQNIDEDDTPFIALALQLNAKLWTGDKTLSNGLTKKGLDITLSTSELKKLLK